MDVICGGLGAYPQEILNLLEILIYFKMQKCMTVLLEFFLF